LAIFTSQRTLTPASSRQRVFPLKISGKFPKATVFQDQTCRLKNPDARPLMRGWLIGDSRFKQQKQKKEKQYEKHHCHPVKAY
jgi:hypothetical protein